MEQRQRHRQQGRFLAPVERTGTGKKPRGLVHQRALQPEFRGGVEEVFQRRRHVAESCRAAEQQTVAAGQVRERGERRPGIGYGWVDGFGSRRYRGYRSQYGFGAGGFHPARRESRQIGRPALAGVVENQNPGHGYSNSSRTRSGGAADARRIRGLHDGAFDEPRAPCHQFDKRRFAGRCKIDVRRLEQFFTRAYQFPCGHAEFGQQVPQGPRHRAGSAGIRLPPAVCPWIPAAPWRHGIWSILDCDRFWVSLVTSCSLFAA